MTLRAADQFHMGIAVDDFEASLGELSDVFGYQWCEDISSPTDVIFADGTTATVRPSFVYSMGAPRLEIIRAVPGSVWVPAESGVHHLGYWSDDLAVDSSALERRGFAGELSGMGPGGAPYWAYHRHPNGLRIETVSRSLQPFVEGYFSTGKVAAAVADESPAGGG